MFIYAELGTCLSLLSAVAAMFAIDYPYRQMILLFKNLLFGLLVVTFCFPNPETANILRFMGFCHIKHSLYDSQIKEEGDQRCAPRVV